MDLEQLKTIWPKETSSVQKHDEYLLSILSKRSNNPIALMKRNLRRELIAIIILYSATIANYFFAFEGKMVEVSWVMLVIALAFFVYYYRKNKLLTEMQCLTCQVKSHLSRQLTTLEKYVKFYLISGNILFALVLLAMGYITLVVYPERLHLPTRLRTPGGQQFVLWYLVFTLVFSVGMSFINKWYVHRLYGRHIGKLREIVSELAD